MTISESGDSIRFGNFQVNLATRELRKHGLRVRLQDQPFQVLATLLERPGEVVAREELVQKLWADGTVVDYEGGLNAAVTRLRQALSDSAETPRYVETVARRGYRFIAPVERESNAATAPGPVGPAPLPARSRAFSRLIALVALAVVAIGAVSWSIVHAGGHKRGAAVVVTPLTTDLGVQRNASFSPDGTQVVYEWQTEDGQRHIYIKVVGAGDSVQLTSGSAAEHGPAWSPDGRLIAFLRQSEPNTVGVFVAPPLGGVERKLADAASPPYFVLRRFVRRLAWTADSSHVIVSVPDRAGRGEGLLSVAVANGGTMWLTPPRADSISGDREPAVSPDGRWVAFARGEVAGSETIQLLRLTDDGRPAGAPRPLPAAGRARSPAWSPDGTEILTTAVNLAMEVGSGISRVRIDGSAAPVNLPQTGPTVAIPAVSRTGRLAYSVVRMETSIWRQEIPSKRGTIKPPVRVTTSGADGNAQYSPDGRRIAFGSNRSGWREIWTCASDGAHCQALTSFHANFVTGTPDWSPDGRQIAFDSSAAGQMDIYVVDANGGSPRRLTGDEAHGVIPSWSRDGKWIYFSSEHTGTNEIWKVPSGGGSPVQITRRGGLTVKESPDGKALYYTKIDGRADLFRSATDGSGERLVLRGVAQRGFVPTPDCIYYLRDETEATATVRAFELRTGEDTRIAEVPQPLFIGLSMSPDGRYLMYSKRRNPSNLMLAEGVFR